MTSWQRKSWSGSRPIPFHNPRATTHTAESYDARYKGQRNRNSNFLFRLARMQRREARSADPVPSPVERAKRHEERGEVRRQRRAAAS